MFMEVIGEVAMLAVFVGIPLAATSWLQDRRHRKEEQRQAAAHRAYVADLFRQIG